MEKFVAVVVRHIVIWKLKEENPDLKLSILEEFRSRLLALKNEIPGIAEMEVKFNAEKASPANDDIVLIADFYDWEALHDYQSHPAHQSLVAWVSGIRTSRSAIDYEI
ncbi:MAG: Dabb family protein [Bacteroidales bacterium]